MKIYRYRKLSPLFFICILQRDRCDVSGTKFYQYQLRYAPMYYNASINKRLGLLMPKTSWFRANYTDCVDCGNVNTHVCVCVRLFTTYITSIALNFSSPIFEQAYQVSSYRLYHERAGHISHMWTTRLYQSNCYVLCACVMASTYRIDFFRRI